MRSLARTGPRAAVSGSPPTFPKALALLATWLILFIATSTTAAFAETRAGALVLRGADGAPAADAVRLGTDVDITVSGPTARARVTQLFRNQTDGFVEATYVYPLPEGGAVDTLKMVIGDRIVVGEVKEKRTAREVYEQAKSAGRKATLVEQERPNLFTNAVANIGPGESVLVQIEYQEPVRQSGDTFSLRLPLVVAPRYNPTPLVQTVDLRPDAQGWGPASDPVPDRRRISPPVLDPRLHAPVNPVAVSVRLQAGFPLAEVKSHHHEVTIESPDAATRLVRLSDKVVPADRDFELTWRAAPASTPSVGLFRERVGGADYLLAFVTPPALTQAEERRPREIVFVIDNSGSMGGQSMIQAKDALIYGLGRLHPSDRFNVVRFDDTFDVLFPDAVPADGAHVARAKEFVGALQARGGTEMVPAMRAALTDRSASDANTLRQVVFLTDGAIGNEQQLFDTITGMRGRSRVFMVGIGSAPNSFLMNRAAELGRGTFTHIGSVAQVDERMRSLYEKLEAPAVTNLAATISGAAADVTPELLPDLYRGEPLLFAARVETLAGEMQLRGMVGGRPWSIQLPLAAAAEGKGLSKVWARRKIADAEVARTLRSLPGDEADRRILALALEHHLVSRLTSLVAVDRTPSRPEGARLTRTELPLNLPAGWDFEKLFGERPSAPAHPTGLRDANRRDGAVKLADAAARPVVLASATSSVQLPQTATDAELRLLAGLALCLLSLLLMVWQRRSLRRAGLT
jgi:Ca-activated chloride channel family protein